MRINVFALGVVLAILAMVSSTSAVSIEAYGAVAADNSTATAFVNAQALTWAIGNASAGLASDRIVEIPSGKKFFFYPVSVSHIQDVTFQLDGDLIASGDIKNWPTANNRYSYMLNFEYCNRLAFLGQGSIDGQGYPWWWLTILNKIHLTRPNMLQMTHCANVVMDGFTLKNSPRYHIQTHDTANYTIRNIIIQVDTTAQQSLLEEHGHWEKGIPTFPLNTDGIDPAGINYLIENVTIDNYDDAVAVKPTSTSPSNIYANCSQNMLVRNSFVRHGVGMTIGSVPPHVGVNCVKDIVFRDIDFETPFKAIYVKTNPGTVGTGIIKNITYENIAIRDSIWWAIYIGPQQQKQPNGDGPGCLFFPINPECPTQPRVPISDLTLRNVSIDNALVGPGIVRCNSTKPCTNIVFDNVRLTGTQGIWPEYFCENVEGKVINSDPVPKCIQ